MSSDPRTWSDKDISEQLLDYGSGLTDWEMTFAEDLAKQFSAGIDMHGNQRRIAEDIVRRLGTTWPHDEDDAICAE